MLSWACLLGPALRSSCALWHVTDCDTTVLLYINLILHHLSGSVYIGLALGIKLAGLPWTVCGVMLAGPAAYYTDQQTDLVASFAAKYLPGMCSVLLQPEHPGMHSGATRALDVLCTSLQLLMLFY